jgi:Ser/Thr protein kinase RdoA (MazF antagonist)
MKGSEMEHRPAREIDLRDGHAWGPNRDTEAGMRFQVKLVDHLRARGYPAQLLAERSPGDGYDPANPAHLREAGRGLARYHEVVRSFPHRFRAVGRPAPPSLEHSGPHALACFTGVAEAFLGPADRARLTRASSFLWSRFIRVPEALAGVVPPLPQLVIHGSYDRSSLMFRGDHLAGVTGYGYAAHDLRAVDLGYALDAFAGMTEAGAGGVGLDLERCAALMAGYGEVESLPAHELAALPLVFRAQGLTGVLTGTSRFLRRHEVASQPDREVHGLVDMVEREAERVRWLETGEQELVSALGGSLVA